MSDFIKNALIYAAFTGGSFLICIALAAVSVKISNSIPARTKSGTYLLSAMGSIVAFVSGYFSIMRFGFPILWIVSGWPKVFSVVLILESLAALYLAIASAHTVYAGYRSMFFLNPVSLILVALITISLVYIPVVFASTALQTAFFLSDFTEILIRWISFGVLALFNLIALLMANVDS